MRRRYARNWGKSDRGEWCGGAVAEEELIYFPCGNEFLLFDLAEAPSECRNRAADPDFNFSSQRGQHWPPPFGAIN